MKDGSFLLYDVGMEVDKFDVWKYPRAGNFLSLLYLRQGFRLSAIGEK